MVLRRSMWWRVSAGVLLVPVVLAAAGCSGGPGPRVTESRSLSPVPSGSQPDPTSSPGVPTRGSESSPSEVAAAGRLVKSAEELLGTTWQTTQLDGTDVGEVRDPEGDPLTVAFYRSGEGFGWTATDGCNSYSGPFSITSDGRFRAEGGKVTYRVCLPPDRILYPRNPEVLVEADQARIGPDGSRTDGRLSLLRDGEVVAVYVLYGAELDR